MKSYKSINKVVIPNVYIYAFDKIDGSNIRAEWSRKKKFNKFGTRTRLVDNSDPIFGKVPELVKNGFEKELSDIFIKNRLDNVTCYFEFYGDSSKFGVHRMDEEHKLSLIDVNLYKKGFINPKDFVEWFVDVETAKMLYHGKADMNFVELVRTSSLNGMGREGVVCKTGSINPEMFKIKTDLWMNELRTYCKEDVMLFEKLSQGEKDMKIDLCDEDISNLKDCLERTKHMWQYPVVTCGYSQYNILQRNMRR